MKFLTIQEGIAILEQNSFKVLMHLKHGDESARLKDFYQHILKELSGLKKKQEDDKKIEYKASDCKDYVEKIYDFISKLIPSEDIEYIDDKFRIARSHLASELDADGNERYFTFDDLCLPILQYNKLFEILNEESISKLV